MKKVGYLKLIREEIENEMSLTDREFRLFYLYLRLAGWDPKHEDFGKVKITVRGVKDLPWSYGKVDIVKNKLISKGFISEVSRSVIRINNFEKYLVKKIKHIVSEHKPYVLSSRQNVNYPKHPTNPEKFEQLQKDKTRLANDKSFV
jgi:hypothetical protein